MPKDNQRKPVLLQITGSDPETIEAVRQFKKFAVDDKNYGRALKRLMDLANVA